MPEGWATDALNVINMGGFWRPRPGSTRPDNWTITGNVVSAHQMKYTSNPDAILMEANDYLNSHRWYIGRPRGGNLSAVIHTSTMARFRATYATLNDWTTFTDGNSVLSVRLTTPATVPSGGLSGIQVRRSGITAPAVHPQGLVQDAPDIITGGTGTLAGAFSYVYTFYNSLLDIESGPSPESIPIQLASGDYARMRLLDLPAMSWQSPALATGADLYRLYRRRVGTTVTGAPPKGDGKGSVQDTYYFVAEFDYTPAGNSAGGAPDPVANNRFHDALLDNQQGQEQAPFDNLQPPPSIQYIVVHGERVIYIPVESNTFYWSEGRHPDTKKLQPEYVGRDSFRVLPASPDEYITGAVSIGAFLYISRQHSWFRVDMSNVEQGVPDVFELEGVPGCASHWTIQPLPPGPTLPSITAPGRIIYANEAGAYVFNGSFAECVSRSIEPLWQRIVPNSKRAVGTGSGWYDASAIHDPHRNQYYMSVKFRAETDDGIPSNVLAYSIDTESWLPWNSVPACCWFQCCERSAAAVEDTSRMWTGLYFGSSGGRVLRMSDLFVGSAVDWPGQPIVWSFTVNLNFGTTSRPWRVFDFAFDFNRAAATPINLYVQYDSTVPGIGVTVDLSQYRELTASVQVVTREILAQASATGSDNTDGDPWICVGYRSDVAEASLR